MKILWANLWLCSIILLPLQAADNSGVAAQATQINPLLVGTTAPDASVKLPDGTAVNLADYLKEKPTVLVFYRGSWCPFCMKQLQGLESLVPELQKQGFRLVAISQDSPKANTIAQNKHKLSFPILSDADMTAAKKFGLAFRVDEDTTTLYKGYGIDLVGLYGRSQPLMAVPGVFVFNNEGKIQFQYVNPDYRLRLAPEVLLAAVKAK